MMNCNYLLKYLRKGASTNQLSQWILFGSLEWLSLHFCFWSFEIPPIREHSFTRITPRIRLVRGRRSLERNSYDSRPWAGGWNRRVRIPQRKAQRKGDDLAQFGDNSKDRRWTKKVYWRRSGSVNIHLESGQRTQDEEKFKKTFLENQTDFHQPPKQEVVAHQHSLFREQCYPHQKLLQKTCGKTCHELLQQADLRRLLQVKQVAFMVPVYQRVLPHACPLQHPWHFQGRKLIILRLPQARLPHQPQLCQARVRLEQGKTWVG